MQSGKQASRSQILSLLAALFICVYFVLFSYDSLNTYFTFDDGMNLIHLHREWEVPIGTNIVDALKVFSTAYRPLGALVYRPLYSLFGFNPFPFRVVAYLLMAINIVLAYRFSRAFDATPEASALATLLFCYNASMIDLYYNTGTIYDLLCFTLYIPAVLVYTRHRSKHGQLTFPTMLIVLVLFLAALDAKEMAVTLPAVLLLYEVLYRPRGWRSVRTAGFLLLMFAAAAAYLKAKVEGMSANPYYHPHLSIWFVLTGMGHYFEQLFYLKPESFGPVQVMIAVAALLGCAAALRSRAVAYGTLFFVVGLLPLSVIDHRSGYAAYIAYPGLTVALATILASARSVLLRISGKDKLQVASTVVLFLCVAAISVKCFAHTRKILMANALWDQGRRIDLLNNLELKIPGFPPQARILLQDDAWGPDWGPMFLIELMYHDPSLWVDRGKSTLTAGDRDSYDLLVTYKQPFQGTKSPRILGVRATWEIRWIPVRKGQLTVTAPSESRAIRNVDFSPNASRAGRPVTVTVPGLSNVRIDAIYRILSNGKSTTHTAEAWCTLDSDGKCTLPAPHGGPFSILSVDWIRPSKQRWIFTNGILTLVE